MGLGPGFGPGSGPGMGAGADKLIAKNEKIRNSWKKLQSVW